METIEDILAAMQAIVDGADGRALTADEGNQYEALETKLANVRRSNELRVRNAAYNSPVNSGPAFHQGGRKPDTYAAAFNAYLRTGKPNSDLKNAQSEGVPSEGGYLVPDQFRVKLVERLKAFGGIGGIAERYTTGNGNPTEWPTIDDTANVGEIVQEGNTFSAGADLVFGSNALSSYSYVAGGGASTPLRVNLELLQDQAFDIEGLLTRLLGTRIARLQATHLATGTGVQQPLGLVTGLTGVELIADTAGITYDDLVNFIHSVDPAYRGNARWVWNDLSMAAVEKIKDSHGDPVAIANQGNLATALNETTVMGYPVTIDQAMPALTVANNTINWGAFGDIQQGYVVRDVRQVELLVNPYSRMANRQIEFTAWARMDATQQDVNAYVALTGEQ